MDVCGISSYFDNKEMMKDRQAYQTFVKDTLANKPLHADEGSSMGTILIASGDDRQTAHYYNNYDVSFHNELWASAFMGGFTALNTWNGEEVHKWKYATRDSLGFALTMLVHDTVPPYTPNNLTVIDTIRTNYYNFKPLSEFLSVIDFTQNYLPCKYYGGTTDYIESYFLKSLDSTKAYGWVHNINKYWRNSYYYFENNINYENYFGCDTAPIPSTNIILSGFKTNYTYYSYFFNTRIGNQILPLADTIVSDSAGNIMLDFSYSPLGCDTVNADYAYFISNLANWNGNRQIRNNHKNIVLLDVIVAPNPSNGIFKVILNSENKTVHKMSVTDITGKIIFSIELHSSQSITLNLSDRPKGIYYLLLYSDDLNAVKKIVLL